MSQGDFWIRAAWSPLPEFPSQEWTGTDTVASTINLSGET